MRITLTIQNPDSEDQDQLLSLDIFPDMTLETVRSSIQAETQIDPAAQHIYHNGNLITDYSKTMEQLQIGDGEMLALHVRDVRAPTGVPQLPRQQQQQRAAAGQPGVSDPETIRLRLQGDPRFCAEVANRHPALAAARDNPAEFARVFNDINNQERQQQLERQRAIAELNADPFNVDAQKKIEEMIRQERVMENLQTAMEHNPEVFTDVHMLYIDVEVNGHKVKALVDSGAQATIMSPSCAESCGIMRLVDTRFAGVAKGVGTAKIVGRVHTAQIKIGTLFLPCSFTVMEGKNVEMLLGLDMLKRHQACIDLEKDRLAIQGTFVPFLGQADLPKPGLDDGPEPEPMVQGPGGTTIGARSGAVLPPNTAPPAGPSAGPPAPGAALRTPQPAPAPAAPPNLPPRSAGTSAPPASSFPEEHIQQLTALGFPRAEAIQALEATGGQVEYAASMLMDM